MSNPHILAVPFPQNGHILPLMELSLRLVKHGFRITFVNTEFNHKRMMNAWKQNDDIGDRLRMVSITDGLESDEDRNHPGKLGEAIYGTMVRKLEELMEEINGAGDDEITCVIADQVMASALEIAAKKGIRGAVFFATAATTMTWVYNIPKLVNDGIIHNDGTLVKRQMIQLLPAMPAMDCENFPWTRMPDLTIGRALFKLLERSNKALELADWLICNSAYDLEPATFDGPPRVIPIGPLAASDPLGNSAGNLWPEDSACLKWLDEHPPCSVIYVAFGSTRIFDKNQFQELALGLELSNMPFLWVVQLDSVDCINDAYPQGFQDRVATRAKIVDWAPQRKVLSHPSIACFFSHGGWNSILEGASNGVPFLCWPYFADQFFNGSYICGVWKVGLELNSDENGTGTFTREDVRKKVEQLLGDKTLKSRALDLKEVILRSVREGGSSYNNFQRFVEWIKG